MEDQEIYTSDWIGLKVLNERGALIRETIPGEHVDFTDGMIASCVKPYLVDQ